MIAMYSHCVYTYVCMLNKLDEIRKMFCKIYIFQINEGNEGLKGLLKWFKHKMTYDFVLLYIAFISQYVENNRSMELVEMVKREPSIQSNITVIQINSNGVNKTLANRWLMEQIDFK